MKQFYIIGQAYGEGAYNECVYSPTQQQVDECNPTAGAGTGSGGAGNGNGSGSLVDAGVAIAFAVTLACLLIFVALVVRFIRRPRMVAQEVDEPRRDDDSFRS